MKRRFLVLGATLLLGATFVALTPLASHVRAAANAAHSSSRSTKSATPAMHTQRTFEFTVKLPMEAAAPLFGADKERAWAPGWNPKFIWPAISTDQQGMVFTIAHGQQTIVWLTPTYNLAAGLIQYAYVIPDVMATLITLKLTPRDEWTHVAVQYERTALNAAARDVVLQMAEHDGKSGPEWETQISHYLGTLPR
jgi:hypothetical protein